MECLQSHPSIMLTIIQYLSVAEYISLRRTLPCFIRRPSAYPLPIDLLKLDPETQFLCNQNGVYLTGGYLLGLLLGESYGKFSDIDLIVKESKDILYKDSFEIKNELDCYHSNRSMQYCHPEDNYYQILKQYKANADQYMLHPSISAFSRVLDAPYNVIYIFDGHIPDYISHFDFGFCKNVADFNNKKLIITDLESILKHKYVLKTQDVGWKWQTMKDMGDLSICINERIQKYRNRGFEITFEDIEEELAEDFIIFWNRLILRCLGID